MKTNNEPLRRHQEIQDAIYHAIVEEFAKMKGLKRVYNPLILQTISKVSESVFERFSMELPNILSVLVIEGDKMLRSKGYLTRNDLNSAFKELRIQDALNNMGVRDSQLMTKFLNDLRRLNVVRLHVTTDAHTSLEIPIIFPAWRDKIRVGKKSYPITCSFHEKLLAHYHVGLGTGVFLAFFEGMNILTRTIMDIYLEYGVFDVDLSHFVYIVGEKLRSLYSTAGIDYVPQIDSKGFARTLNLVFKLAGLEQPIRESRFYISNDVIEYIARELGYEHIDHSSYLEALKLAWKEYWKGLPSWYASLERLIPYINDALYKLLHRSVNLPLSVHLKYVKELARWGLVEYWYGGLDPERKHWLRLRTTE